MTTKTTGAEFKAFYNDPVYWNPNESTHHDDELIKVDDHDVTGSYDDISDTAIVEIDGGDVFEPFFDKRTIYSFEDYFKHWQKTQKVSRFVVECDKQNLAAVKAAIIAAGGKIHE